MGPPLQLRAPYKMRKRALPFFDRQTPSFAWKTAFMPL
jgi:hypothetical protein